MLSRKLLDEFKQIMKEETDNNLKKEESDKIAIGIVNYFDLLNKINCKNKHNEKNIRKKSDTI